MADRQWVFPAHRQYRDSATGERRRHHLDPTVVQRALAEAVRASGIGKRATCHTFPRTREWRRRIAALSGSS